MSGKFIWVKVYENYQKINGKIGQENNKKDNRETEN